MKLAAKLILNAMLVMGVVFLNSCKKKKKENDVLEPIAKMAYNQTVKDSLCESNWFPHTQTPPPAEGKGSPFDVSSTTNAIFHQWSWQKFLWLTKPTDEVSLFYILVRGEPTPIKIKAQIPLFLNPKEMHQVTAHMQDVKQKEGAALVLVDTAQAGPGGILKTNPAYNKEGVSETVFYSIHVSPTMKESSRKYRDSIVSGTLSGNNQASFPVGSLELKVSWTPVTAIAEEEIGNYYTTVAALSRDGETYTNTEVALLGMHVVGIVENHPEFIWATFEHDDLAPNYNWKENKAISATDKLLFEKINTTGIDGITWSNDSVKLPYKAYDLFKYGVPRDSVGNFMKTSQEEPMNFDNIENINTCVKENLTDVWKNYFYNGSLWIDTDGMTPEEQTAKINSLGGNIGNATPDSTSVARGSVNCANVTMETYTQTFKSSLKDIEADNLANCFSCHNTVGFSDNKSPLYISHVFNAYLLRGQGKTFNEVEAIKAKQEVEDFMKNSLK
ncbi:MULTISPECIES: hypothetical protein [Tenacibaculum]|uniref:Cytochrome c domain-containing protein n=1 Tax=Tenacibaculum mesophilum TaxID=104268 RepID=A0ABN5T389_9FLAO|nr:hypothetical protein [Tenacibaculum mesophilum]GFD93002.1 hypothetical protein KUL154_17350 [Alteromonas sp. KUL154]GFE03563.1 hypothetical protein KUL156_61550 [Alteromonas sp. KUL156]AZJ31683.1 hypothetical protein D6200_03520 [Tenacibaculum mesophilum]KAF9657790.1 hypothetical protein HBA12_11235 [Tenacibaculum mesophilum]QFS26937.1 hypothetical protein F9Y86_00385 [Tenacibaculum mesophilum]